MPAGGGRWFRVPFSALGHVLNVHIATKLHIILNLLDCMVVRDLSMNVVTKVFSCYVIN